MQRLFHVTSVGALVAVLNGQEVGGWEKVLTEEFGWGDMASFPI